MKNKVYLFNNFHDKFGDNRSYRFFCSPKICNFFFLNVIFCPKTAIVSKMCKDQDLGRVQKYSVPIKKGKKEFFWSKYARMLCTSTKRLVTISMILILAFEYFMLVFSPKIHPDSPNISQK